MTDLNFDFTQVNPIFEGGSFLPISDAKGWLVILNKDDGWKQSQKAPNNWFLQVGGICQEGPAAGQEFVLRFNLKNDNPKAVAAAAQELAALGYVTGCPGKIGNITETFNKPFRVVSEQQKDAEGKPTAYTQLATNGIHDVNGNMAGKAGAGPQTAAPAPQAPAAPPAGQPFGAPAAAPFGAPAAPAGAPFGAPAQPGQPFTAPAAAPFGAPPAGAPFGAPAGAPAPFGAPQGGGAPAWAQAPGR